jgi:dihydroorotase
MLPLLVAASRSGSLTLNSLIRKTSWRPAELLGIQKAGYSPGDRADFAIFGKRSSPICADDLHSRAGWTPFEGIPAVFPEFVILSGKITYRDGEFFPASPRWYAGRGYHGREPMNDRADTAPP